MKKSSKKSSSSFADRLREAYRNFYKSIVPGGKEHDIRMRFIHHVVWKGFGYPERCVINEKNRTDIWLLDREPIAKKKGKIFPIVVIETKDFNRVDDKALLSKENIRQAFSYAVYGATRYIVLTNFRRFVLWRAEDPARAPIADLNLYAEALSVPFVSKINELIPISYEEILRVYEDFSISMNIDLADSSNFETFTSLVKWKLLDELLIPQFRRLAENLSKKYVSYEQEKEKIVGLKTKFAEKAKESSFAWQNAVDLERQLQTLERNNTDAIRFNDCYEQWQMMVYPPTDKTKPEERLERFIKETAYTMLSRIILIRMGEDLSREKKDDEAILAQKISNGGLIKMLSLITRVNEAFKQILRFAFEDAEPMYKRLFMKGVYDWYWEADGELNQAFRKALWHLNHYDFAGMEKDTFKSIYQYHMDRDERRKIGEYYTPDEVVDYILDRVGYIEDKDLRGLRVLDPGSGSGTFILEAALRLRKRLRKLGLSSKEIMYAIAGKPDTKREFGYIFGFDINPFAVYLSEANLLLHLMREIQGARKECGLKLDKFQIYRTNTLEPPLEMRRVDAALSGVPLEAEEISIVKRLEFDFVIGNPPYVRAHRLTRDERKEINTNLKKAFPEILGKGELLRTRQLDLYIVFTAYAISWLKEGGQFSFILSGKFLTSMNGEWLRKLILDTCAIEEIVDVMRVKQIFKTQDVYPIILVLRREPDEIKRLNNQAKVKVVLKDDITLLESLKDVECSSDPQYAPKAPFLTYTIPQRVFQENPKKEFQIYTSKPIKPILDKIADPKTTTLLGSILLIERGVERGGEDKWKKRLKTLNVEEYGKNFITKTVEDTPHADIPMLRRVIDGNTVGEFVPDWRGDHLCYDKEWLNNPRNPELFEKEKKLIIPRRAQFLKASIDTENFYILDDVYTAQIKQDAEYTPDLKYLLGLLNSTILDFYHKIKYMTRLQADWFDYYDYTLSTLPIRRGNSKDEKQIGDFVDGLIKKKREILRVKSMLQSVYALIESSGALTCRAGLSRLVGKREGGEERIERVQQKGNTLVFNRDRTIKLRCVSEEAASFIKEILKERFEEIKGERLNDILGKLQFPEDEVVLRTVLSYRKNIESRVRRLQRKIGKLKESLDAKVARLYGLSENEHTLIKQASYLISTTLE